MENKVKIVVCSKNKAKNTAVENVIKQFINDYSIYSLDTNFNVSETPIDDEEGIIGCMNKIKDANLYIAMEGILTKTFQETFLCGWTVIYNSDSNEYLYRCSAKYMNSTEEQVRNYGTNDMFTNGCYTRTDEFMDSLLCAISTKFCKLKDN